LKIIIALQLYGFADGGPFGHFLLKLMHMIFKGKKGQQNYCLEGTSFASIFVLCLPIDNS
jgi:hypothetical protein